MAIPKTTAIVSSALFVMQLLSNVLHAQYVGVRYSRDLDSGMSEYYCLRTEDGKLYQLFPDWVRKAREENDMTAISVDSMIQIVANDPQSKNRLYFNYMFGRINHVAISDDSIRQYFNGIDSTEVKWLSEDTLDIMRLSDAYSEYICEMQRFPIRQTLVLGDTTLPAIHPINIEFPEVRYLPEVIMTKNHTWHLTEVFYDQDRINHLLSILYRNDFQPLTEKDFKAMLNMFGMTKQEWWNHIQKLAEEKKN